MMRRALLACIPQTLSKPKPSYFAPSTHLSRLLATSGSADANTKEKKSVGRMVFEIGLISITAGLFVSCVDELAIYHGCTSKAIEKASKNQKLVEAIGLPIVRGPWYDSSLAVGDKKQSVSCTFPVSGPQGSGIFQLKAIRQGDDSMFSLFQHNDWDILIMEALLHVPANDEKHQTFRINLSENFPSTNSECLPCKEQFQDFAAPKD